MSVVSPWSLTDVPARGCFHLKLSSCIVENIVISVYVCIEITQLFFPYYKVLQPDVACNIAAARRSLTVTTLGTILGLSSANIARKVVAARDRLSNALLHGRLPNSYSNDVAANIVSCSRSLRTTTLGTKLWLSSAILRAMSLLSEIGSLTQYCT